MARLFPLRSEPPSQEGRPRVVDLEDEDADAVFSALSSETARKIYSQLNDDPGTASDVADAIGSSIQNVRYHLEKLEDAGLVEIVDTWYSSRGNEMSVYATTDGPLIVTNDRTRGEQLKEALSRFVGGVAVLGGASLVVQRAAERFFAPTTDVGADSSAQPDGGDGAGGGEGDAGGDDAALDGEDAPEAEADADDPDAGGGNGNGNGADDAAAEESGDDFGIQAEDADAPATGTESEGLPANDTGPTTEEPTTAENATEFTDGGVEATDAVVSVVPPGLLFFLGGLVVLTAIAVYWYWRAY